MPKKTILSDKNYEIAYDSDDQKFYLCESNSSDLFGNWVEIPHNPPFNIEVGGKEVVVFSTVGNVGLGYREKSGKEWSYGIYKNNSLTVTNEHDLPRDVFSWHKQRQEISTNAVDTKLTPTQRTTQLDPMLFGGETGPFAELKKTCTSREEYASCLRYLLGIEKQRPKVALIATNAAITDILDNYFNPQLFKKLPLNNQYEGHMATLTDVREYIHQVLWKELQESDSHVKDNLPPLNLASWNYLCAPGESERPTYEQPLAAQTHIKNVIQAIEAVYKFRSDPIALKNGLNSEILQTAAKYLSELLNAGYGSDLTNLARPFLIRMLGREASFDVLKNNFLLPLYQAVAEGIHQTNLKLDQPKPEQFQVLPVDYWDGVRRLATHTDFVNEQFKNPQAIFIIPDNFKDADLPPHQRHEREGRGGLAGPMRPIKVSEQNGSPIYDLCTLGIPTGGKEIDLTAAKEEVTKHFAKLYGHIRNGRTIAVPYVSREGNLVPAFGGGTFADSALTAQLKEFIFEEFDKLKKFCNGTLKPENLEEKYKKAWNDPAAAGAAILLLPQIAMPKPPEPPGILGEGLNNPGIRANFNGWFDEDKDRKLSEHVDENHARILTGSFKLSTGDTEAQITIHKNKIVLNNADQMTIKEFKEAMSEVINLYIAGYQPGEPPPTKASGGTPERKAIIEQLLKDKLIKVVSDTPESAAPTGNAPPAPATDERPLVPGHP